MSRKVNIVVNLSTATPTVDGGEGSPGDPADKTSAKGTHQHPAGPVAAVTSTLYAVPDNAGNVTITPPTGEGTSYLNAGSLTSVYPASGSFVQAAFEQNATSYYLQADGSLGVSNPGASGDLTATLVSGTAAITMNSTAIGQTTWPSGTIPVSVWAWITGGVGSYTFGLVGGEAIALDRGYVGGGGSAYMYSDHSNLPPRQTITSTPTLFTFNVPCIGTTGALTTDYLSLVLNAFGSSGAVLHIGYGGSQPLTIPTLFPPPGSDYWAGMARLPFISLANVPGLLTWNAGNVGVLVNCQMSGGIAGHVYEFKVQLLRVTGAASSVIYQGNGSFCTPGEPVTSSPQVFTFNVPVQALAGLTTDQLVLDIIGTSDVGGVPAPATVFFRVNTGGADPTQATQIQTLFVPGGGSGAIGDHQLLTNRGYSPDNTTGCHPQSAITQVALTGTVVGQLLTPPTGANIVVLSGGETIKGIDNRPWPSGCGRLLLYFQHGGHLLNYVSTGDSNFSSIAMGNFGGLSTTPGSGQADKMDFGNGGAIELFLADGSWNMISMPNTGQV